MATAHASLVVGWLPSSLSVGWLRLLTMEGLYLTAPELHLQNAGLKTDSSQVKDTLWPTINWAVSLGGKPHLGPKIRFLLPSDSCVLLMWGALSDGRMGLSFVAVIVYSTWHLFTNLPVGILHNNLSRVWFLVDTYVYSFTCHSLSLSLSLYIYIYIYICVCVCVCTLYTRPSLCLMHRSFSTSMSGLSDDVK
jgi:hypothetical protein